MLGRVKKIINQIRLRRQAQEIASITQRELSKSGIPAKVTVRFKDDEELQRGVEFIRLNCVGCKFANITTHEWIDGPHDFYREPCLHPNPHVADQYHCLSRVPAEGKDDKGGIPHVH